MKKISPYLPMLAAVLCLSSVGCEEPQLPESKPTTPAAETAPAKEEPPMVAGAPGEALPEIAVPVTNDPRPVTPDDPIKGRRSKRAGGYLGATAHARFAIQHKAIYDMVKYNLGIDMALNGDYPQSNEEFFKRIIKGYSMKLPELEPEHEYVFVPEEAEVGLQIRLKQPGSPPEASPTGAAAASYDISGPGMLPGAGGAPGAGASPEAPATEPAPAQEATPSEETTPSQEEPSPDIRTRAGQLGEDRNEEIEKRGLAPVGGLGE
jgi:hypothetical protein